MDRANDAFTESHGCTQSHSWPLFKAIIDQGARLKAVIIYIPNDSPHAQERVA